MKEEEDYFKDLTEIRSLMERSSKFLSLSGWAGIMAGIYALLGAFIAFRFLNFNPDQIILDHQKSANLSFDLHNVIYLAIIILISAISTAIILSKKKANKNGDKLWNATSRRVLINMSVPLVVGGLLILILISNEMIGLVAPFSLLFYGLALYQISKFTFKEVKILGLMEIALGLISAYFVAYGLLFWAIGFGLVHIIYGIYMYYKYER